MRDVTIESLEITLHGGMDSRREMVRALKCMKYLVTLGEEGGQSGTTHLEPAGAMLLVMGGGKSALLQYCLLVRIVVHVIVGCSLYTIQVWSSDRICDQLMVPRDIAFGLNLMDVSDILRRTALATPSREVTQSRTRLWREIEQANMS